MMKLYRAICQVAVLVCYSILAHATGELHMPFYFLSYINFFLCCVDISKTPDLYAFYSQHGIKGTIRITYSLQDSDTENVNNTKGTINFELDSHMDVEPASYTWALFDLPVEYTQPVACDKGYLGEK